MEWNIKAAFIRAAPYAACIKGRVISEILPQVSTLTAWCARLQKLVLTA